MAGRAGDCDQGVILNITLTLAYPQDLAPGLHFVPQSPVSQGFASLWAGTGSATTAGEAAQVAFFDHLVQNETLWSKRDRRNRKIGFA
jgi:hypothetical protein